MQKSITSSIINSVSTGFKWTDNVCYSFLLKIYFSSSFIMTMTAGAGQVLDRSVKGYTYMSTLCTFVHNMISLTASTTLLFSASY